MKIKSFRDLIVWQKSFALARLVHDVTKGFPREELFGLVAQLRRAAASIPSNIAEGHGRITTGEFLNQLSVARGSLNELRTQVLLSADYGYMPGETLSEIESACDEIARMLWALISSLNRKRKGKGPSN